MTNTINTMMSEYEKLKQEKLNECKSEQIGIRTYPYVKKYYQENTSITPHEAIEYYAINKDSIKYYKARITYLKGLQQKHEIAIEKIKSEIEYLEGKIGEET